MTVQSSRLSQVQLITRGPRALASHSIVSPLSALSQKGGAVKAVKAVSPTQVVAPTAILACRRIFQENDLHSASLSMLS